MDISEVKDLFAVSKTNDLQSFVQSILKYKPDQFILLFLDESKTKIINEMLFKTNSDLDKYLFQLRMNHDLLLFYHQNDTYYAGARFLLESWSYKLVNEKCILDHYNHLGQYSHQYKTAQQTMLELINKITTTVKIKAS